MKNFTRLWVVQLAFWLLTGFTPARSQSLNLRWIPREDLNVLLPASVRIYETNDTLPNGSRIRAMYAAITLSDANLRLRAVGETKGSSFRLKTTKEYADIHKAFFAVNGGFFSSNASVSLVTTDGEAVAPNAKSVARNGQTYYPTRSAFGLINRKPDVAWVYGVGGSADGPDNTTYFYPQPSPNQPGQTPQPPPSPAFPAGGQVWPASQAIGGFPVLVQNGAVRVTNEEELTADDVLLRNPRTAIGYLEDNTIITMVVDGRQRASAGVTLDELAQMFVDLGAKEAMNLDGGGSSTMYAAGEVVNNPVNVDGGDRNNLRANASAWVLSEITESARKEVTIVDTDSDQYTEVGLWSRSNVASYYGPTASRQASVSSSPIRALYRFNALARGRYQVAAWWTVDPENNAIRVPYIVHHGNRHDTVYVDQREVRTTARWNVLGTFEMGPGDYVELLNQGQGKRVVADAVRLVTLEKFPDAYPDRGNLRVAVISDLNASLGSATYEWQVDSIMRRIPRIWRPDLVVCGGDMVAGQGPITNPATIRNMWRGFDRSVLQPLRSGTGSDSMVPFAFTIGNHDGVRTEAYRLERELTKEYWDTTNVNLHFIDKTHFPYYYSFQSGDIFVASWDASSATITEENLAWLRREMSRPEARAARMRFVMGHLPLYSVAQERDAPGNVLNNKEQLRALLEELDVHTYLSGHHHAYYPGKRGKLELLNAGAAGSGPRPWLSLDKAPVNTITIMDIFYEKDSVAYTTYDIAKPNAADMTRFDESILPRIIYGYDGTFIIRRDAQPDSVSGTLSALHLEKARISGATGTASATFADNKLIVRGAFDNLESTLLEDRTSIALYNGRHGDAGRLLKGLQVTSSNGRNGSFYGEIAPLDDDLLDQLAAGSLFIQIKTAAYPQGEIQAQLYHAGNKGPRGATFRGVNDRNVYAVRDIEAILK